MRVVEQLFCQGKPSHTVICEEALLAAFGDGK